MSSSGKRAVALALLVTCSLVAGTGGAAAADGSTLSIEQNTTTVTAIQAADFTVTQNGTAVNATVSTDGGQSKQAGSDGTVSFTFDSAGEKTLTASYNGTTTTKNVTVEKRQFEVNANAQSTTTKAGGEVQFKSTVEDSNGNTQGYDGNYTLSFNTSKSDVTITKGDYVQFDTPGTVEVTVSVPDNESTSYVAATTTIDVTEKSLSFSNTVVNGTNAYDLTVSDNSGTVNATLSYADGETATTGADGEATLTFEQEGEYTITADAGEQYETATKTLTVDFDALTFASAPSSAAPTENVSFTVKNTGNSSTIGGVNVSFGGVTKQTSSDGTVAFAAPTGTDSATATAQEQYYTSANTTVTISEDPLTITKASPNGTNTVDVNTKLDGNLGNATLTYAGGKTATTGDDGTTTLAFTQEGEYEITAEAGDRYETDNATVSVSFHDLTVTNNDSADVVPEGDIQFTVKDSNTSNVVGGVDVTFDGQTKQTAEDGTVTFTAPATEQTVTVDVTKQYYDGTSTEIAVDKAGTDYNFTANRTDVVIGQTVEFVANNSNGPQAVTVSDNESWQTDAGSDGTATRTFELPGTYEITANGTGYENRTVTVEVSDRTSTLTLGNDELNTNKTTVRNLTLDQAYNGLSGYRVMLTLPDNGSATFNESETSYVADLGLNSSISVTDDGTALELEATDVDENIQAESTNVTLAQVGIDGESAGQANVSITVESMESDPDQETDRKPYQLQTETAGGQFTVLDVPTIGDATTRPSDTDDDGVYEDVNGNGEIDYDDVVSLYNNLDSQSVQGNADAFDLDGNGAASYNDIVQLNGLAQPDSDGS